MGMSIGSGGDEDEVVSAINTTPLVDVMLVLLIIFLITIPVVSNSHNVTLPIEQNTVRIAKPEDINVAVDKDGVVYWNEFEVKGERQLLEKLKAVSQMKPQPEVHIRGDQVSNFEHIGKVLLACQRAGIAKIGFITEPPGKG